MIQNTAILNAVNNDNDNRCSDVEMELNNSSISPTSEACTNDRFNMTKGDNSQLLKSARCKRIAQEVKEGNDVLHVMASGLLTISDI